MNNLIQVNEWIEKLSEIKPQIDQVLESLNDEVIVMNSGCSERVMKQIKKYIEAHGARCVVETIK